MDHPVQIIYRDVSIADGFDIVEYFLWNSSDFVMRNHPNNAENVLVGTTEETWEQYDNDDSMNWESEDTPFTL